MLYCVVSCCFICALKTGTVNQWWFRMTGRTLIVATIGWCHLGTKKCKENISEHAMQGIGRWQQTCATQKHLRWWIQLNICTRWSQDEQKNNIPKSSHLTYLTALICYNSSSANPPFMILSSAVSPNIAHASIFFTCGCSLHSKGRQELPHPGCKRETTANCVHKIKLFEESNPMAFNSSSVVFLKALGCGQYVLKRFKT